MANYTLKSLTENLSGVMPELNLSDKSKKLLTHVTPILMPYYGTIRMDDDEFIRYIDIRNDYMRDLKTKLSTKQIVLFEMLEKLHIDALTWRGYALWLSLIIDETKTHEAWQMPNQKLKQLMRLSGNRVLSLTEISHTKVEHSKEVKDTFKDLIAYNEKLQSSGV
jgi:hypothetical protein